MSADTDHTGTGRRTLPLEAKPHIQYILRSQGPPAYERYAGTVCRICIDTYESPIIVSCGHCFCMQCIMRWLQGPNKTCPACKSPVNVSLSISNKDFTKRIPQITPKS